MKAEAFGRFLAAFSAMLGQAGAAQQAEAWWALAQIFNVKPAAKVSDICKVIAAAHPASPTGGATVADVVALIPTLRRCLADHAKKVLTDDIDQLAGALAPAAQSPVLALADAVAAQLSRPTTVARPAGTVATETYLRELEGALHDEARFAEVFNRLKKEVKKPAAIQIALEFAKGKARTKGDALNLIWGRHASLLSAAARAQATGGRTAA